MPAVAGSPAPGALTSPRGAMLLHAVGGAPDEAGARVEVGLDLVGPPRAPWTPGGLLAVARPLEAEDPA